MLSVEKSNELAEVINGMRMYIFMIDFEYAKEVCAAMMNDANRKDTLAVLNPMYMPEKSHLIRLQATALRQLVGYIETLKEIDELKTKVQKTEGIKTHLIDMLS